MDLYPLLWLIAVIVFVVLEASTTQFISIWFAISAAIVFIISFFSIPFYFQLLIFTLVAAALLIATRPLAKNLLNSKKVKTNADRVVGETGICIETIDNIRETGRVKAMGLDWLARTEDQSIIEEGSIVRIIRLDGVKVIVTDHFSN